MLKISIPTPCHEDWDAMIPNSQGRHCNSCVKTVIDFTNMSDEEVKHFFINKKEEKICGRFKNEQLHRITIELPQNIFYLSMPAWKKFLAACLLVFSTTLFSCETKLAGVVVFKPQQIEMSETGTIGKPVTPKLMGDTSIALPPDDSMSLKGDVRIIVDSVVSQGCSVPAPPIEEMGIIEEVPLIKIDTPVTNNLLFKKGEPKLIEKDTVKAGTDSCNNQIFY
jgi:hypothetical protein